MYCFSHHNHLIDLYYLISSSVNTVRLAAHNLAKSTFRSFSDFELYAAVNSSDGRENVWAIVSLLNQISNFPSNSQMVVYLESLSKSLSSDITVPNGKPKLRADFFLQ